LSQHLRDGVMATAVTLEIDTSKGRYTVPAAGLVSLY
jgi:hypothetical protein